MAPPPPAASKGSGRALQWLRSFTNGARDAAQGGEAGTQQRHLHVGPDAHAFLAAKTADLRQHVRLRRAGGAGGLEQAREQCAAGAAGREDQRRAARRCAIDLRHLLERHRNNTLGIAQLGHKKERRLQQILRAAAVQAE
jgi:hypothetical protein